MEGLAPHLAAPCTQQDPGANLAVSPVGIEFVVTQLKSLVLTLGLMDLELIVGAGCCPTVVTRGGYQVRRSWSPTVVEGSWGGLPRCPGAVKAT